ncbi:MAG: hypothetical protein ACJ702_02935, partial [Nitrososphaeraceae archaeon]
TYTDICLLSNSCNIPVMVKSWSDNWAIASSFIFSFYGHIPIAIVAANRLNRSLLMVITGLMYGLVVL